MIKKKSTCRIKNSKKYFLGEYEADLSVFSAAQKKIKRRIVRQKRTLTAS
jgi:hypothetical protein